MKTRTLLLVAIVSLTGCKKDKKTEDTPTGSGSGSAETAPGNAITVTGFTTPESVLYDADADLYLVSNINGGPAEADDNGFISRVSPDGTIVALKWIDGAADGVKLDAPKGTSISGGTLWVADITVLRKFDAKTGAPTGDVKIEGATFLNDVYGDGGGGVYVSDSGLDPTFKPTGTDAVYHVASDGTVSVMIKDKDLGHPNGVWSSGDGSVWVVTFGTGELFRVTADGKKEGASTLPKGQLDGIIQASGPGDLLVSSWEGSVVYRGNQIEGWKEAVTGVKAPADIGYDSKRKAALIPKFQDNEVVIQLLP